MILNCVIKQNYKILKMAKISLCHFAEVYNYVNTNIDFACGSLNTSVMDLLFNTR